MWRYPFLESRTSHPSAGSILVQNKESCGFKESKPNLLSHASMGLLRVSSAALIPLSAFKEKQPNVPFIEQKLVFDPSPASIPLRPIFFSKEKDYSFREACHLLGSIPLLVFFESEPCKDFLFVKKK